MEKEQGPKGCSKQEMRVQELWEQDNRSGRRARIAAALGIAPSRVLEILNSARAKKRRFDSEE